MKLPLLLTCAGAALLCGCQQPGTQPQQAKAIVLWNGGPLTDWKMAGPGEFVIEEGSLRATGGMGLLWYAKQDFQNFRLELEWKTEADGNNSGIFVRFPDPGTDPWIAVNEGYELQICDAAEGEHGTGAVYDFCAPSHRPTKPAGEWNTYSITVVGQDYTLAINGEIVNRFLGFRGDRGYVGLQNHDDGSPVRFRNIRITPL